MKPIRRICYEFVNIRIKNVSPLPNFWQFFFRREWDFLTLNIAPLSNSDSKLQNGSVFYVLRHILTLKCDSK